MPAVVSFRLPGSLPTRPARASCDAWGGWKVELAVSAAAASGRGTLTATLYDRALFLWRLAEPDLEFCSKAASPSKRAGRASDEAESRGARNLCAPAGKPAEASVARSRRGPGPCRLPA